VPAENRASDDSVPDRPLEPVPRGIGTAGPMWWWVMPRRLRENRLARHPLVAKLAGRFQLADLATTVGTQGLTVALQAVHSIMLARMLGAEGRGEYSTVMYYSQLLVYTGLMGTLFSIARRAARATVDLLGLSRAAVRVGLATGIGCMTVVVLLALWALPAEKAYLAPWVIAATAVLPLEQMRLALLAVDHGAANFGRYNVNRIIAAAVFPLLLGLAWLLGLKSLSVVVALAVISPGVGLLFLLRTHRWLPPGNDEQPRVGTLIHEGAPYALSAFATQLLSRLDGLLVLWLVALSVQGYYAVAVSVANLLLVGPNAFALFSFNAGARTERSHSGKMLVGTAGGVLLLQIVSGGVLALIVGPMMGLVFGSEFLGAVPLILALLPGFALDGLGIFAQGYLRGRGKPLIGMWARFIGAAVMLLLVWLTFDRYGPIAIPISVSVANAVCALLMVTAVAADWYREGKAPPNP